MWRRTPCLRSPQISLQRAWKSTRKTKKPQPSTLFESNPAPVLPRATIPSIRLSEPSIPFERRFASILVAFTAGFSIYFFLDDPELVGPPSIPACPSPSQYVPTKLTATEPCGPDTKLLKIAAPSHLLSLKDSKDAAIWSVSIKDDDIQVERAYTPLTGVDDDGNMMFWIKKYPAGEVGRWLHNKSTGDTIEIRGPIPTYPWKDDNWDEVVMISGGTGITPFFQLFNTVISKPSSTSKTRFTLLHSSRSVSALPPSAILEPMATYAAANPDKFRLRVFVDELDESNPAAPVQAIKGRIQEKDLASISGNEAQPKFWWNKSSAQSSTKEQVKSRTLFIVCGPEPMINTIAGPYGRNFSQGSVGGILQKLGYTSNEVYKL